MKAMAVVFVAMGLSLSGSTLGRKAWRSCGRIAKGSESENTAG
jgi:hypothetical protein